MRLRNALSSFLASTFALARGRPRLSRRLAGLAILYAVGLLPKALAGDSEESPHYCLKNNSQVQVLAEIKSIERIQSKADLVGFRVHATIRIVNTSTEDVFILAGEPLIRLTDAPIIGPVAFAKTRADALSCRYIYHNGFYPSKDTSAVWKELRSDLDQRMPPERLIRRIAPGATWEFARDLSFGVWNDLLNGKSALDVIRADPSVWLQIELLTWPNNLEKDMLRPEFAIGLRERWKRSGHLIIDNLVTEPVKVSLLVR